jgi:hypothetical protein
MSSYDQVKHDAERAERHFAIGIGIFVVITVAIAIALTASLVRGAA